MIITCENCNASYAIPLESLGQSGRNVKCAKCAHTWFAKPSEQDLKEQDKIETPKPAQKQQNNQTASSKQAALPQIVKKKSPLFLKLLPVMLFCAIFIASTLFYKGLMIKIPGMASIYDALDNYPTDGIIFDKVSISKLSTLDGENLILRGSLYNNSSQDRKVPDLRFRIKNRNGKVILNHIIPSQKKLKPGEKHSINNTIRKLSGSAAYLSLDIGNPLELMTR